MTLSPDDSTSLARPTPRVVWLALLLVAVVALSLRLVQIHESLWLDELHTAWTVADDWTHVVSRAKQGNTSPLYFCLPWLTTKWLGMSETALRLPSAAMGVAVVLLMFGLVRQWTKCPLAALIAAALAAIDPTCLFYAQEARAYASVQAVGLVHVWLFANLLAAPTRSRAAGFVGTAALLFYLHYTSALLFVAEAATFLVFLCVPKWRPALSWRWGGAIALAVAAMMSPALPHIREIAARRELWQQVEVDASPTAIAAEFALGRYAVLPIAASTAFAAWRTIRRRLSQNVIVPAKQIAFVAIWFFVPVALAWLATACSLTNIFLVRYVIVAAVAPMVFATLCVAAGATWRSKLTIGAAVTVATLFATNYPRQLVRDGRLLADRNENWRDAVRFINERTENRGLPVVICSGLIETAGLRNSPDDALREFCLLPVLSIYRLNRTREELIPSPTTSPLALTSADRQRIRRQKGAWLIVRSTNQNAVDDRAREIAVIVSEASPTPRDSHLKFGDLFVIRVGSHLIEEHQ